MKYLILSLLTLSAVFTMERKASAFDPKTQETKQNISNFDSTLKPLDHCDDIRGGGYPGPCDGNYLACSCVDIPPNWNNNQPDPICQC